MINWSSIQLTIDDHINILLDRLKKEDFLDADWNSRIVAFTHAIIISPFCVSLVCKYGFPWNKTENDYNEQEIDLYYKAISISLGYFLWDIFYSISDYKKGGIGFIIHGICAFIIYIFTFTIFLNIYWTLDKLELSGSALQMVVAVLLMITFFSVRVAFGTITLSRLLCMLLLLLLLLLLYKLVSVTKDSDTPSEPKKDIPIKPRQASKGKKSTKKTN
ncbi:hypothetical protein H8356DRAFT_1277440 [Neocallimastix lanati (nom. inval.)]|uniref:TLC domain-containing protein n=1 Tax=Neocallimastix californiae TaxID=1754190 RepID=A0A1Y2DRV1_9FUNG|nr:hypothetical protein H8356DRAFT_1277440 [Neocallimastix sp. JGI-2020a]ORY61993.1 hypothetical protein LY90DRAFT_701065 [Neocallimastix californiae]|eukprot:ORY61993.1 hypothetical protein LY90DRAFT_701065 [Neocallimastix californiae]